MKSDQVIRKSGNQAIRYKGQNSCLCVVVVLCLLFLSSVAYAAVGPNWIKQFGIIWTFDKNISTDGAAGTYRYGTFGNGDYWVVGPVKIIGFNPPSFTTTETYVQDTETFPAGVTINGSMINPNPNLADKSTGNKQGYTSMLGGYLPGLNVALDVSVSNPLTVPVNSSLISTSSRVDPGPGGSNNRSMIYSAAILTVLSSAPAANSFRPAYCGSDKAIRHNISDLNGQLSLLGNLAPVGNTPALTTVEGYFERPWLDHKDAASARFIHPYLSMSDYGRDLSNRIGIGALCLQLNYTNEQKMTLLKRYVQLGIDLYGIIEAGGKDIWAPDGGHASGRKWPILFAGIMLNDTNMKAIGGKSGDYLYMNGYGAGNSPSDYIHFGEDDQTFYVGSADVYTTPYTLGFYHPGQSSGTATCTKGSTIVTGTGTTWTIIDPDSAKFFGARDAEAYNSFGRAYHIASIDNDTTLTLTEPYRGNSNDPDGKVYTGLTYGIAEFVYYGHANVGNRQECEEYISSDMGLPDWGIRHATYPAYDGKNWNTAYRNSSTATSFAGWILAAHIMNAKQLWNHNALFDYQDRYVQTEVQDRFEDAWTGSMWDTYRANYGPVWPEKSAVFYGDVSGDGQVTAYDSALTAQAVVGLVNLTANQTKAADVSGDGQVSAYDAALIAQKVVGLITKFPVEG